MFIVQHVSLISVKSIQTKNSIHDQQKREQILITLKIYETMIWPMIYYVLKLILNF